MTELHTVQYGATAIEFNLVRRGRKTLSITVTPEMGVEVVAPQDTDLSKVLDRVQRRTGWISRQLVYFSQFQPRTLGRKFVPGETHLYLGRQYKLKVTQHIQEDVKLSRGILLVQSHKPLEAERTRELLEDWYRRRAHVKFRERIAVCKASFSDPEEFEPKGLIIRHLEQRWGSMTSAGRLILNRSLIRASIDAIDYVVTHELCHLRYNNHGSAFYKLLDRVMPDWEKRKTKLERQLS